MHFEIVHEFDIPLDALELAVISPDLVAAFGAKVRAMGGGVHAVTERSHSIKNGVLERVWHYQGQVRLPAFARAYVTPERMAWDEVTRYEAATHRGKWTIEPSVMAAWRKYFAASGTYAIEPLGDGRSRRVVHGTLDLRVAVVRQVAERLIVNEVKKAFEAEAATLRDMATLI